MHESAHSVADLVLGGGVLEVWVVGDGGIGRKAMSDARRGYGIAFVPTDDERAMVERLSGLLLPQAEIARDWIKPGISTPTLRKHFREELRHGRARTLVRLLRSTEAGSEGMSNATRRGNGIAFVPTADERTMVERLAGLLVTEEQIAQDWIKPPISRPTLRKHFAEELKRGRQRTLVRLKATALRSAEAASVRAQIYLLERFFRGWLPPMPSREMPVAPPMPAGGAARISTQTTTKPGGGPGRRGWRVDNT